MGTPSPGLGGQFELHAGAILGKYEIVRRIATGGMAEIYLARARGTAGFEKLVVLKRILPSAASDPAIVQMFLDEARLAATLQHPNIADVYDVGEANGAYFFTMEFIHGQDVRAIRIAERMQGHRVPLAIALAIVQGTVAALDYAHDKTGPDGRPLGLVHRDVSSSNVLVSYDGAIKLVDFGIARANAAPQKTRTGTLKGKIPYMSPEQAKGQPVDGRSDLFSLGVVLYELTVGRRPFRGPSDFAILEQIVHLGAPPPSQSVPNYPPDLEAIVMKLLARDPAARYPSGEQVLHDLEELVARHQLWVSAKTMSRYMRALFAAPIAAWQAAEHAGVSLDRHLVHSYRPAIDLVTPATAISAITRSTEEEDQDEAADDVVARLPHEPTTGSRPSFGSMEGPRVAPTTGSYGGAPTPTLMPSPPPRSRLPWIGLGVALCAGAAIGGITLFSHSQAARAPVTEGDRVVLPTQPGTPTPDRAGVAAIPPPDAAPGSPDVVVEPALAPPDAGAPDAAPRTVPDSRPPRVKHPPHPKPDGGTADEWDVNSPFLPSKP